MLKNYLNVLRRNFARNKAFTIINILGLTMGITCSLVMFLVVKQEFSFNRYHENLDSIYRLGHIDMVDGRQYTGGGLPLVMPPAVKEEIVGLKEVTLVAHEAYGLISVKDNAGEVKHYEEDPELVYVEPNFFKVFTWKTLEGSVDGDVLEQPNVVALSKTIAEKYFPDESAVGKTIRLNKQLDLKVVAILEDDREDSDFPFGIFISMETKRSQDPEEFTRWGSISSDNVAFFQLENNVTPAQIEEQFPDFVEKHWNADRREQTTFVLSPFTEYHFDERFSNFSYRIIPKSMLYTYIIIGAFLIVTACVNFINMSTAMSVKRGKEVGMRKVLGSDRKQLIFRFLGETFVITLIALLLSMAITERLMPLVINDFMGITIPFKPLTDLALLVYLLGILITVSLFAGLYPAFVLSGTKPILALKGGLTHKKGGMAFRRFLVFFQFFICQVLIFGTVVALTQMKYFFSVDMGYDQEWILNISLANRDKQALDLWESEIQNIPGVENYSFNFRPPFSGSISATDAYVYASDSVRDEMTAQVKMADKNYLDTYGLTLLSGQWLNDSDTTNQFVVNETFVKKLGLSPDEAINKRMQVWGRRAPIVGVVKDFHVSTLSAAIEPVALFNDIESYSTLGVRVNAANAESVVASLENIWYQVNEEYEFNYQYVDDQIVNYYEMEQKMSQMLTVFAGIAIFIGCLGLYGLVSFMANQKAKEIGIRKVLGASVANIMRRFSLEFILLVGIAFLLAAPLAYYFMNIWLSQYEYRISIGPLVFIISIVASLIIALTTTGYRSMRAATANPVQSLRDE
ncbi:ABC transporter permease [Roseivirga pacifica]|uniref:ABC transporter permease n=1 Tax=Roseivirga pacifica TaxID=1267423 RepID=UPI002095FBEB|nr:ABC transporter permease [Roseivirga pacifica]MCO6357131.1 FtsX-like permease family protein [Roseivirga pacifica]MCO6368156.1 FtsX-like permease family protein [Roseivirga pacifica]MCO6369363.1 FtsX-like permease family protein [Roseivirga pacifica]MCO6373217.1 FtsX-like permease family protein [Roseivirga pacifica]MCO6377526.1 FtsX-like permease family protein [Roseivirga pacifica]